MDEAYLMNTMVDRIQPCFQAAEKAAGNISFHNPGVNPSDQEAVFLAQHLPLGPTIDSDDERTPEAVKSIL
jgi:hypothetical protein